MRNRFSKTFKLTTVLFALPILAFLIAIVSSYSFSSSYQHSKAQNYFSNITMLYNKEGLLKSNIELPKSIHIKRGERLFLISEIPDWDSNELFRFLYKGIIIKHNKTEPTYTKTSLFLCEKRRFFMGRTEKGGKVF